MIADKLIDLTIWIYQNTFLRFIPSEFSDYPVSSFSTSLDRISNNLILPMKQMNNVFPVDALTIVLLVIIIGELFLFSFKGVLTGVNIARGSGA